jgi:predicted Zn-dependent peptidase
MIVTLVGDFNADETLAMVKKYFGQIPPGTPVPRVIDVEPKQRGEKRVTINFDAEPSLSIGFHKPAMPHRDDYCADLLMDILTRGATSRLYKRLVVDEQLVSHIESYGAGGSRYPNLLVIDATPRYPHTVAEVESAIYAELDKLKREPVSQVELKRARNRLVTDGLRQMRTNSGLARMLSSYQALGSWHYLVDYAKNIEAIDPPKLLAFANRYLTATNRTVVVLQREGKK